MKVTIDIPDAEYAAIEAARGKYSTEAYIRMAVRNMARRKMRKKEIPSEPEREIRERIRLIMDWWARRYERWKGEKYVVHGKDVETARALAEMDNAEEIAKRVDRYLQDPSFPAGKLYKFDYNKYGDLAYRERQKILARINSNGKSAKNTVVKGSTWRCPICRQNDSIDTHVCPREAVSAG